MIIPLQGSEASKQHQLESTAGERATASSPVNEDGNVSSEPELAADSSGDEGQGNALGIASNIILACVKEFLPTRWHPFFLINKH